MANSIRLRSFFGVCWFVVLVLALPSGAVGQSDAGSISGSVRDPSGAIISGVLVTLTNEETGQSSQTKTGSIGEYTFSPVKIGHYSVSAEFSGFEKLQQNGITVNVQQNVQVNIILQPGQTRETVVVNAAPPALQTLDASVGQVVGEESINALPLNGRNFTFLAQLSAGVTQDQEDTRGLGASGSFAANGLRPAQNNYLLDGLDNNSNLVDFLNGTAYVIRPPVDALQEFKVETSNFSAEMGRAGGAVLNATIKSGTNQLHGAVWEFLRNDALDAANYFTNAGGLQKGEYRQNQFGFTVGGPIRRNKTFFFGDYEGTRIRQAIPWVTSVPTALERSSGFTNLSELLGQGGTVTDVLGRSFPLGQVFDPSTTRSISCGVPDQVTGITASCPAGTSAGSAIGFAREIFPGNQLPGARLDPNAINLLKLYPAANNSGLFNNYTSNPVSDDTVNQFDIRVDHTLSAKDNIFTRWSYVDNPSFLPGPFGGIADGGSFSDGNQSANSYSGVLSETHVFSQTLVNEARAGYSRIDATRLQPNANTPGIPATFNIGGIPQGDSNGGLGSIFLTGLSTLGSNGYLPSFEYSDTSQVTDNVTKTAGRQTIRAGVQWQRLGFSILQPPNGRGSWSYQGLYTEVPTTTGGNTGLAQLLLTPIPGTVAGAANYVGGSDGVNISNIARTSMGRYYYGLYFQDDVKVTSKLTANLGLRWDHFGVITEHNGRQSNLLLPGANGQSLFLITKKQCNTPVSPDFTAAAIQDNIAITCSGQPGLSVAQNTNFSPRLGFAYQPTPKSVIRGGYGIYYGGFENSVSEDYVDFPFQFNLSYPYLTPDAPITYSNGAIATIETGVTAIPLTSAAVEPGGVAFYGKDYHAKTPYTQGYNLTVQYQVGRNDTVQAGYIGNTVRHLVSYANPNTPQEILPPGLNSYMYSPYPDFSSATYSLSESSSQYNSLQITYERRLSAGLTVLANYTYANCLSNAVDVLNNTSLTGYRAAFLPGFGIGKDFGLCDYDVRNVVHFSGSYELPVGKGREFLSNSGRIVDALAGGWDTNWILTLQDGQPGTVPCAVTTTSGLGCFAFKTGQSPYAGPHNVNNYLNPAAYTNPPVATTIGQSDYSPLGGPPSNFRGPGFDRLDFSLFKEFQLTERFRLEFRSEFFNLPNHPNFSNPGFAGNGVVAAPGALNFLNTTNFGKINSTRDGQNDQREIQFALKLYY
jgi:hypothetical protein